MTRFGCKIIAPLLTAILVIGFCPTLRADEIAESARKIVEANKDAIVTIEMVVEMKMSYENQSEKRESKSSGTGVVVDPSGLVITSLTALNPGDRDMGEDSSMQVSTRIMDAKLRMPDGTEVPMDVVLRDRDLDMLFLRPKKPADQPFKCVSLAKSSAPQVLDTTLTLTRLGQIANRSISASMDRVSAVVNKPRLCYVLSGISGYSLGSPVFTLDGNLVGITFVRSNPSKDDDSLTSRSDRMIPVTLPCSIIQSAAAQAMTAKPEKLGEEPIKPPVKPAVKPTEKPTEKPGTKPPAKPATKPPTKPAK